MIHFDANKEKDKVLVSWSTASEINSSYYNFLRSADGQKFDIINKTAAAGNSNTLLNYSFIDEKPLKGTSYYKLIEYDFDGQHQESKVVTVDFSVANVDLSAYPNPTNHSCSFNFQSKNGGIYYLKAINSNGQEVYSAMVAGIPGDNKFTLSMQDFASGIYHFQLYDSQQSVASVKVVKE